MDAYDYDELFCRLPPENTHHGEVCPGPQAYFRGETYMKNAKLHLGWQVICAPLPMEEPHFHHGVEEYLVFFGAQLPDVWASWDAEIDIMLGFDRDDMHMYTITQPTVVRIPPNLWHCPINFRKINKPVLWQAIYEDGTWARVTRRIREDGSKEYIYDGDNIRLCVKNKGRRCVFCGECFHAMTPDAARKP